MSSVECVQDIHICGGCRAEFSDICLFIEHKKKCVSTDTAHFAKIPVSEPNVRQATFYTHRLYEEPGHEVISKSSAAEEAGHILDKAAGGQIGAEIQTLHYDDFAQGLSDIRVQNNRVENVINMGGAKNLDKSSTLSPQQLKISSEDSACSITWESTDDACHRALSSQPTYSSDCLTVDQIKKATQQNCNAGSEGNYVATEIGCQSHDSGDIAVYVVSSTIQPSKVNEQCLHVSKESRDIIWSGSSSVQDQQNSTLNVYPCEIQKQQVFVTESNSIDSASIYCNLSKESVVHTNDILAPSQSEKTSAHVTSHFSMELDTDFISCSDSSTPCPEDLEVGQISATMVGIEQLAFKTLLGASHSLKQRESSVLKLENKEVHQGELLNGSLGVNSDVKLLNCDIAHPSSYIRENTASAPITKCGLDTKKKKKGVEKRERLQGVSDDLMSSSPYHLHHGSVSSKSDNTTISTEKNEKTLTTYEMPVIHDKDVASTTLILPTQTSYRAVFTSPSSAGHRLTPKLVTHSGSAVRVLESTFLGDKDSKSTVYRNISASTRTSHVREQLDIKEPAAKSRKTERKLIFDKEASAVSSSNFTFQPGQISKHGVGISNVNELKAANSAVLDGAESNRIDHPEGECLETAADCSKNRDDASISQSSDLLLLPLEKSAPPDSGEELSGLLQVPAVLGTVSNYNSVQYPVLDSMNVNSTAGRDTGKDEDVQESSAGHDMVIMVYNKGDSNLIMVPNKIYQQVSNDGDSCYVGGNSLETKKENGNALPLLPEPATDHLTTSKEKYIMRPKKRKIVSGALMPPPALQSPSPLKSVSNELVDENHPTSRALSTVRNGASSSTQSLKNSQDFPRTPVDPESDKTGKGARFGCSYDSCKYTAALYKDIIRHHRTHTGERPFACKECGKTFNRSDKLKIHLRWHTGYRPFQCPLCDYAAVERGSLKKHLRIHTDERPFKCQICPYASRNSSQLIVHLRTHTGDAPFHCKTCSAQFKINSDLKRHLRIHTGEKPFQCDKCDYKSSNKGNLKTHYKINHSPDNEKVCSVCSFASSSAKRFREHVKTHDVKRIVRCTQCDYTCANLNSLRSHMSIHNPVRPYCCGLCSYSSKQRGNLKKHIQSLHLDKPKPEENRKSFTTADTASHISTGRKTKTFRLEGGENCARQRRSASYRKLHRCEKCGSGFVREDSLRCHMKQHSEAKPESSQKEAGFHVHQTEMTGVEPGPTSSVCDTAADLGGRDIRGNIHLEATARTFHKPVVLPRGGVLDQPCPVKYSKGQKEWVNREQSSNGRLDSKPMFSPRTSSKASRDKADGKKTEDSDKKNITKSGEKKHSGQPPWEHRSYTLSLPGDDKRKGGELSSTAKEAHLRGPNSSAKVKPTTRTLAPARQQWTTTAFTNETGRHSVKRRLKKFNNLNSHKGEKNVPMSTQISEPASSGQPQGGQLKLPGVSQHIPPFTSPSADVQGVVGESPAVFTQQCPSVAPSVDVSKVQPVYNIQLIPQASTGLSQGAQVSQVQNIPSAPIQSGTQIQIVLPRPTASAHIVNGIRPFPSQQLIVQLSDQEVVAIPVDQVPNNMSNFTLSTQAVPQIQTQKGFVVHTSTLTYSTSAGGVDVSGMAPSVVAPQIHLEPLHDSKGQPEQMILNLGAQLAGSSETLHQGQILQAPNIIKQSSVQNTVLPNSQISVQHGPGLGSQVGQAVTAHFPPGPHMTLQELHVLQSGKHLNTAQPALASAVPTITSCSQKQFVSPITSQMSHSTGDHPHTARPEIRQQFNNNALGSATQSSVVAHVPQASLLAAVDDCAMTLHSDQVMNDISSLTSCQLHPLGPKTTPQTNHSYVI